MIPHSGRDSEFPWTLGNSGQEAAEGEDCIWNCQDAQNFSTALAVPQITHASSVLWKGASENPVSTASETAHHPPQPKLTPQAKCPHTS